MIRSLYAYYDDVAETYSDIFTFVNDAVASRWFKAGVLSTVPEPNRRDYKLVKVAQFNESTGSVEPLQTPTTIFAGAEYEI